MCCKVYPLLVFHCLINYWERLCWQPLWKEIKLLTQHFRLPFSRRKERKVKLLSCVWLFATPRTVVYQALPSVEFSRQGYWSGLPCPSPGDLPDPGIEPGSPTLQADALPSVLPGKLHGERPPATTQSSVSKNKINIYWILTLSSKGLSILQIRLLLSSQWPCGVEIWRQGLHWLSKITVYTGSANESLSASLRSQNQYVQKPLCRLQVCLTHKQLDTPAKRQQK